MRFACVIFVFVLSTSASVIEDFQDINCTSYDPEQRLLDAREGGNCLSALFDPRYRQEFEKCKENVCFLLIREPPFVTYVDEVYFTEQNLQMQLPFLCKNPRQKHRTLGGVAFNILKKTSAGEEFCAWAGPLESCTWNAAVDFVAVMGERHGYQFAVVGPMLETPQRKCFHYASGSWWDGRMVVLGRNAWENGESVHPIWQLTSPFQKETWIVVGSMMALFVIVCLTIVHRFRVFRGKSLITAITAYFVVMGEKAEALASGRIANTSPVREDFATLSSKAKQQGSRDLGAESSLRSTFSSAGTSFRRDDTDRPTDQGYDEERKFLTKFSLAISLFRISLIAFVALFSLFYEVSVVNFLFQQQNLQITKDIEHLTLTDLERYALVQDTAMEAIWNFRVNPKGTKFDERDESQIPWKRCRNGTECFSWIIDESNPVQFYVSYELEAMHLVHSEANCEMITMFQTKGPIHHFNSGWLFNARVPVEKRRKLNQELGALKIDGTLSELLGGRPDVCSPRLISSLTSGIILLPVAVLVLPPLFCSAVVAICWRRFNARKKNESIALSE